MSFLHFRGIEKYKCNNLFSKVNALISSINAKHSACTMFNSDTYIFSYT